jgi:hypothetical protein
LCQFGSLIAFAPGVFPSPWKTSVIFPLIKDEKKERTTSNAHAISFCPEWGYLD